MGIGIKTRKLLWGRSGSRCAFCRTELIMDATQRDEESVVGDECHICSGKVKGPRYDASFPEREVDSYSNLILLCRVHHKMVDDQAETYTAERLRQLKADHEAWVRANLDMADHWVAATPSQHPSFAKVKSAMPKLIAEMKADLEKDGNEFIREFFIVGRGWILNVRDPCFVYYFDDHENLQGQIHVLGNHGFVYDVTPGNAKKYRMTEEFVDLVLSN